MKFNNVKIKALNINKDLSRFDRKYTYLSDNATFSRNVNFSKSNSNILMTKYDGASQAGLSYFSLLTSLDGSAIVNYISSEAIKIFGNIPAADNSGFYLAGNNTQDGNSFINCLISKIDNSGNEVWKYSYAANATSNSFIQSIDLDSNGDIIAGGASNGLVDQGNFHLFFIKFNTSGITQLCKIIETTIPYRVCSIKIDISNNYAYFIARSLDGENNLLFGCLDNNFDVVWLKSLTTTGTERTRANFTIGETPSNTSIAINGSSVFATFTSNDNTLVGGTPFKPIIIEFNKSNGTIIKSQYINSRHDYTYLKFENGLMKFFGTRLIDTLGNYAFLGTISNWSTTPSLDGYYYDSVALFGFAPSFVYDIQDKYIFGLADYPTVIKTSANDYNYLATTIINSSFSNISITLSDVTASNVSTATSFYNTPITPTYTWDSTIITVS